MRQIKLLRLALMAVLVLGAIVASMASAGLPELNVLEKGKFPVTAEGTGKGSKLETVSGSKLEGTGFKLKLEQTAKGSLGKYNASFTGVKEGKNPCKTAGAAKEEVVVPANEYHWVFSSTKAIQVLFLVSEFTIECGEPTKLKIKVKGSGALSGTSIVKGTDFESTKGNLKCAAGKKGVNEFTEYLNSEEKSVKGILESNFGLGFEQSCEQSNEEVTLKASQMVVVN